MKVLLLGAGGPAGVNFARAAIESGYQVFGQDDNEWHVQWAAQTCTQAFWGPVQEAFDRYADEDTIVWAQPESAVQWLADRDVSPAIKFSPSMQTVALCADKFETGLTWRRAELRHDPILLALDSWDQIEYPAWIRARHGAGARGAILAENRSVAGAWLDVWSWKHPEWDFIAEEYLPGRDFCWSAVYWHDELMGAFLRERLEWIYPHLSPSGRTGTPSVSKAVIDPGVSETARLALEAVRDATAALHGVFCVDLRLDADGVARPTEINAGRWATTTPIHSPELVGLSLDLAAGHNPEPLGEDCVVEGRTVLRHIDCPTLIVETVLA